MTSILQKYAAEFRDGRDLQSGEAEQFLDALIRDTDESILAEVLTAWNQKEISEGEIYAIARIMRDRCTKIASKHETFVDIVGTGGSRNKTFNVSTGAAFVAAGAGVPIAKHGNKAATSNTGSADVLSALGVEPAVDAATAERCLNEIGICFMFAPNYHRLSPTLAKVRRGLGFPTIFNCVGPLCNPAGAPHQLIGVWSREMVPKMAGALARLGTKKSWVVHGSDGLDEVSLAGPTFVAEVDGEAVKEFQIKPSDFGYPESDLDGLSVESAAESATLIRRVIEAVDIDSTAEGLVVINAGVAIFLAGVADDLHRGAKLAAQSVRDGVALRKLDQLAHAVKV